jgi:hypothetical protein
MILHCIGILTGEYDYLDDYCTVITTANANANMCKLRDNLGASVLEGAVQYCTQTNQRLQLASEPPPSRVPAESPPSRV